MDVQLTNGFSSSLLALVTALFPLLLANGISSSLSSSTTGAWEAIVTGSSSNVDAVTAIGSGDAIFNRYVVGMDRMKLGRKGSTQRRYLFVEMGKDERILENRI
jgi:hypothetical protein